MKQIFRITSAILGITALVIGAGICLYAWRGFAITTIGFPGPFNGQILRVMLVGVGAIWIGITMIGGVFRT